MRSFGIGFVIAILALIILLANSLYIVTDKQTAILLRFGEIIDPKIESGLHFKAVSYTHLTLPTIDPV